jgi:hypothetical protein
VPPYGIHLNR